MGECLKCGQCLSSCPVYKTLRDEAFSPRAKVSLSDQGGELYRKRLLQSCLLCGGCQKSCSGGLKTTDLFLEARKRFSRSLPVSKRVALFVFRRPWLDLARAFPLHRLLSPFSRPRGRSHSLSRSQGGERVLLFPGCLSRYLFPEILRSALRLLTSIGYSPVVPPFDCCGFAPLSAGMQERFERLKRTNTQLRERAGGGAVVTLCPTGYHTLTSLYGWGDVFSLPEFLKAPGGGMLETLRADGRRIALHLSCHTQNFHPRANLLEEILRDLPGVDLQVPQERRCCGFGGSFAVSNLELSERIARENIANFDQGAEVITDCPGCALQIGRRRKVSHVAVFLDSLARGFDEL